MKVSVLLGVSQMVLGVFLSLCNHLHFGDHLSAVTEFAPRLTLLLALFGYMDFMIVYKWCIDWSAPGQNRINCGLTRRPSRTTMPGWC